MEILRCEHLCKQYGTGNACVKALDDVSFSVEKGEFVSIIGPSGSGKSTLLHILGGVDRPTSGKVFVNGTELHSLKEDQLAIFRRRQIGLVYQFYNLLPVLTVDENIMLPHLLDGHPKDQGRLDQVVAEMGLADRRNNLPSQLSGGQQQRVSIARALAGDPSLILADEPTGALDSRTGREVLDFLKKLNEEGNTIVMITHDSSIALEAKRVVRIHDGKINFDGDVKKYAAII